MEWQVRNESASHDRSGVAQLRALLEVTRLVGSEVDVHAVLDAVAETISGTLGFRTVAINLYRPAWDDFQIAIVHGNEEASSMLVGHADPLERWAAVLDPRYERRGAFWIPAEEAWNEPAGPLSYTPQLDSATLAQVDAWHAEDSLIVPLQGTSGELLGMVSVDEPLSCRRPTDDEIDVLVAVSAHAAFVLQAALIQDADERHLAALEHLLEISARLNETLDVDEILQAVCTGISEALRFRCVSVDLVDTSAGTFAARAAVGWSLDDPAFSTATTVSDVEPLLDPQFELEGCFLLPSEEARARFRRDTTYVSSLNGRGPHAWQHHWLLVPLRSRAGELRGLIWVDEPEDQLVPSRDTLQALRVFANQAQAALESAAQFEEVRFLADHDPLTRLFNRRAYMSELESELDRAQRYGNGFALVLCDLDGFKKINDTHGHLAGDAALQRFSVLLSNGLRTSDRAFRVGGDEFALLLVSADAGEAEEAVARLTAALAADPSGETPLSASFGSAVYPADGKTATELIHAADGRLYSEKRKHNELP
jgi:diguanylate cyclase (GGDEF)-like protein